MSGDEHEEPEEYPWSVGNDYVRFRYVNWKGEGRLFMDTTDEKGIERTFRITLQEIEPRPCSSQPETRPPKPSFACSRCGSGIHSEAWHNALDEVRPDDNYGLG